MSNNKSSQKTESETERRHLKTPTSMDTVCKVTRKFDGKFVLKFKNENGQQSYITDKKHK